MALHGTARHGRYIDRHSTNQPFLQGIDPSSVSRSTWIYHITAITPPPPPSRSKQSPGARFGLHYTYMAVWSCPHLSPVYARAIANSGKLLDALWRWQLVSQVCN